MIYIIFFFKNEKIRNTIINFILDNIKLEMLYLGTFQELLLELN